MNLSSQKPALKSGEEPLCNGDQSLQTSLLDFWRWYGSDLLSNATRGIIAEFIVANALHIPLNRPRNEWANYDLDTPDGIKVEVKSAAYLQSWDQNKLSTIQFVIGRSRKFDKYGKQTSDPAQRWADMYIFCLFAHQDKSTANPLNVSQWEFYVLPTQLLNERTRSQQSITLNSLNQLAGGQITYHQIDQKVHECIKGI